MTADEHDRRSALLEYATEVASADDTATVFEEMTEAADTVFDFDSAVVETEEDGVLSVQSWSGGAPSVAGIPADEGLAGHTYQTGETVRVPDVFEDDRTDDLPEETPRSVVTVPVGDVGIFQAAKEPADAFDDEDVELVELLATHAGHAIERIRSQRQVAESEQRFRRLFEESGDPLVLYDTPHGAPGRIQHANAAAESLFDATEAELREHTLAELLAADRWRFVPEDGGWTFETDLEGESGDRVLDVTVEPFFEGDGPDAFAVVRDVTEQHHRERTLTSLHDATRRMLVTDDREEIADVMVEAAGELLGLPYVGVFYAYDDELRPSALSSPVRGEAPVLRAGESVAWKAYEAGEPRWFDDVQNHPRVHNPETPIVQEYVCPLGDHGVLVVGAENRGELSGSDRDLVSVLATNGEAALDRAERVRVLREREAELRRERNRLAALFENVPSPTASFVVEDGRPLVQSVNPAFERVFGYDESELVDGFIDDYIVPPEREDEAALYNEKLRQGQNVNVEVRRQAADGPRDFLLDVVPFRLDEPNVHGYAMYTDITERKERERELERQNDRLEEFAGIVSHDLRNPLNVARGYVELAEQTGSDEHFERVETALERMNDIIEDVLTLARQGRSLEDTEPASLAEAADDAWQNVTTADATLEVAGDVTVAADPTRFGSLLENLFGNAVEHAGDGVTVTVGPLGPGDAADGSGDEAGAAGFYVADDGVGIPEERRDDVFTSGETFSDEGTGFGLAIVESIAEAHGWRVSLAESEDGGARFEFRPDGSAVVSSTT